MKVAAFLAPVALGCSTGAIAQSSTAVTVSATSDFRERGLSLSGGRASASASVAAGVGGVSTSVTASMLRGAARFGGADVAIDGTAAHRFNRGAVFADLAVFGRTFPGARGGGAYGEFYGGAGVRLAIAEVDLSYAYAPRQSAIGGDNRYIRARTRLAIVGSPFTLTAHAGRSSGEVMDADRAARLRPGGAYTDWGLTLDHVRGPLTIRLGYSDTDVNGAAAASPFADARHTGARVFIGASLQL